MSVLEDMRNGVTPVFEIIQQDGQKISIYANGVVEGCEGAVLNMIPAYAAACASAGAES